MADKIVIGPFNRGLRTDVTPFNIDNDSFPVLINAYQWRGRIKRKRGTSILGRLQRYIGTTDINGDLSVTLLPVPIASGIVSFTVGSDIFFDEGGASPVALSTNGGGSATLDRTTGALAITGSQASTDVIYFPRLPVMGLEEFDSLSTAYPGTVAFDTDYAYNIATTAPYDITDVSFYKNPPSSGTYVQKSTWTPLWWNGQDYQQFWTTNYQGAMWTTNGIDIPFTGATIGMQYAGPTTTPSLSAASWLSATTMQFTIVGNTLVVGDFVFANEFVGSAGGDETTLNFQTGYVTTAGNTFTVTFPNANITNGTYTPGILQYLTNTFNAGLDCIRWYDGNPTDAQVPPSFSAGSGWVNFMPPLSQSNFSIADLPPAQYYLVGARVITAFKDRLLFTGPVVQTSTGSPIYLQDTVIFSENGTPYYTGSFQGDPRTPTSTITPLCLPSNQTAFPAAWFEDSTGFGGYISAGIQQEAVTVSSNEDVLLIGFDTVQTKLVYTGNDLIPFNFFLINSELGSSSTFSSINLDEGSLSRGSRGITITSQNATKRIDLDIADEVFEIRLTDNGSERFTAVRDYINEWVFFTYPLNSIPYKFPSNTLQYNYRDNSWAQFFESYTTYGIFRKSTGYTWATIGQIYPSWASWNDPWNAGTSTLFNPEVIAGNQQGFVVFKDDGTSEATSLTIQSISGNTITSPSHGLNDNDYIVISAAQGTVASLVNGNIFSVYSVTEHTFKINPSIASATYLGGGLITRLYVPYIQTKQFPAAWGMSRKTRIGTQRYLLSKTAQGQITLLIFLSENADNAYNTGGIVPSTNTLNNALIYSTVLYTAPESTNLGLTPANINLQTPTASAQEQIWHRVNTSLIGDTIQLGITLSDDQMRTVDDDGNFISQQAEIEIHGIILDISPSQELV